MSDKNILVVLASPSSLSIGMITLSSECLSVEWNWQVILLRSSLFTRSSEQKLQRRLVFRSYWATVPALCNEELLNASWCFYTLIQYLRFRSVILFYFSVGVQFGEFTDNCFWFNGDIAFAEGKFKWANLFRRSSAKVIVDKTVSEKKQSDFFRVKLWKWHQSIPRSFNQDIVWHTKNSPIADQ